MSIYATVKEKYGDAPAYPSKSDYTKYFGYHAGKLLGEFDSVKDAKNAGAVVTETAFDEEGYEANKAAYRAHQNKITDEWGDLLRAEYASLDDETYSAVYALAYEQGHSAGYGEVENYMSDYADLAIAAQRNIKEKLKEAADMIDETCLQIEYLDDRLGGTGTGVAVVSRARAMALDIRK